MNIREKFTDWVYSKVVPDQDFDWSKTTLAQSARRRSNRARWGTLSASTATSLALLTSPVLAGEAGEGLDTSHQLQTIYYYPFLFPYGSSSSERPTPDLVVVLDRQFRPYGISGSSIDELKAQMVSQGLKDPLDGSNQFALTNSYIDWRYGFIQNSPNCALGRPIQITVTSTVDYPHLNPSANTPADLITTWNSYEQNLKAFETERLKIAESGVQDVVSAIETQPPHLSCDALDADVNAAATQVVTQIINQKQIKLTADTNHGATLGAHLP